MTVRDCRVLELPRLSDERGHLTFLEETRHVPFPIRRVYYLYDVPEQVVRGGHAHKELQQVMIAIHGAMTISVDDGVERSTFRLDRPDRGLFVPRMVWRDLADFSPGAVCLVIASEHYDENDYFRTYEAFTDAVNSRGKP